MERTNKDYFKKDGISTDLAHKVSVWPRSCFNIYNESWINDSYDQGGKYQSRRQSLY
ncbi:MAG: hypothetical protein ACMUIM_03665 [bacterium]